MAAMAYLTAVGARQGDIKGDVTLRGREGSVALVSVSHEIDTPYDVATGHISGKRQHKPLVVIALLDRATPKLYQALVTNEVLTGVKIEFLASGARDRRALLRNSAHQRGDRRDRACAFRRAARPQRTAANPVHL